MIRLEIFQASLTEGKTNMFSNYSKLIAAIIGPLIGIAVIQGILPASFDTETVKAAIITILTALTVYIAPANVE